MLRPKLGLLTTLHLAGGARATTVTCRTNTEGQRCSPLSFGWRPEKRPGPADCAGPGLCLVYSDVRQERRLEAPVLAISERPVLPGERRKILRLLQLRWPLVPSTCQSRSKPLSPTRSLPSHMPSLLPGGSIRTGTCAAHRQRVARSPSSTVTSRVGHWLFPSSRNTTCRVCHPFAS